MTKKPKLFKTKNGKRYIRYKNKKYIIRSPVSDRYIIKNFVDIIKQLINQRKRRKTKTTKNVKQQIMNHAQPEISGSVSVANAVLNSQMNKFSELNNNLENAATKIKNEIKALENTKKSESKEIPENNENNNRQMINEKLKQKQLIKKGNIIK